MRFVQYQGMVHSRNDGTSFNVLGIDGCVTPTLACTPNFSQIESNVLPIIFGQLADFSKGAVCVGAVSEVGCRPWRDSIEKSAAPNPVKIVL